MAAIVTAATPDEAADNPRLRLLLAMAMFVLVIDTSMMNVSISAAFILINSKIGDLIGREKAYVIGLLAYALGALTMALTQSLTPRDDASRSIAIPLRGHPNRLVEAVRRGRVPVTRFWPGCC